MDSHSVFNDMIDFSTVGLDALDSDSNIQPMDTSFWNSEFSSSFAPDFTDSHTAALENPAFEFTAGAISGFPQALAGGLDAAPANNSTTDMSNPWTTLAMAGPSPMRSSVTAFNHYDLGGMQQPTNVAKRPFQAEFPDFPCQKKQMISQHQATNYLTPESLTFSSSNTTQVEGATPRSEKTQYQSSQSDLALDEDAADVCSTWFSKRYSVFPSDKDITALSHLTRMPASAIRNWFGDFLARGLNSENDSAYMSQSFQGNNTTQSDMQQGEITNEVYSDRSLDLVDPAPVEELGCNGNTSRKDKRMGKKSCHPTSSSELLCRDESRIYQCTRKCGKRYVRKCDWKRNEQEGYPSKHWLCSLCQTLGLERAKPCYRRYHFTQHFNNIHPTFSAADYEADSLVETETSFPRQCGFCPHTFSSRQERIDHIAEHFKQGKCMLDWDDDVQNDGSSADDDSGDDDDSPGDDSAKPDGSDDESSTHGSNHSNGSGAGDKQSRDTDGSGDASGGSYASQISGLAGANSCQRQGFFYSSGEEDVPQLSAIPADPPSRNATQWLKLASEAEDIAAYSPPTTHDSSIQRPMCPCPAINPTGTSEIACSIQEPQSHLTSGCDRGSSLARLKLRMYTKALDHGNDLYLWSHDHYHKPCLNDLPITSPLMFPSGTSHRSRQIVLSNQKSPVSVSLPEALQTALASIRQPSHTASSFLSTKFLGMGGFSTVEEVLHLETGLRVCRKTVRAQRKLSFSDLSQEVEILQQLRHPHIIRFLGSYGQGDKLSILLAPVADMTLSAWLENFSAQVPSDGKETVLRMFGCLTSSVRYLHAQRPLIAHTDIKPQNILIVQSQGDFPHVILSDFGISRASNGHLSNHDFRPMTPRYCAPEAASHASSRGPEADIWSLGCVFLEMALAVREHTDGLHHGFREEFTGTNFYHKDVPRVHWWLDRVRQTEVTDKDLVVLEAVKTMLDAIPDHRPDASSLALVFTPGSCCVAWPSRAGRFPGPREEVKALEVLLGNRHIGSPAANINSADTPARKQEVRFRNASDWLQTCTGHHHFCAPLPVLEKRILPARLLDVHPTESQDSAGRVVESTALPSNTTYVALSYLWNPADELILNSSNSNALFSSIANGALSKPVADAILATRRLGLRYLWVDALCVLQDSLIDRREECAKMADLYRGAIVTISANYGGKSSENHPERLFSARDGGFTFNSTPDSSWDTRAWSQQERMLSKRTLYLTENQLYWECPTLKASDTLPRGLPSLLWESVHCNGKHSRNGRLI